MVYNSTESKLLIGVKIMITKEVNAWLKKVEKGNFSSWDIMEEFAKISKHLTPEEMEHVKKRLSESAKH